VTEPFGARCDEFTTACKLTVKLALDPERETVLHFLDMIRRKFPALTQLRQHDQRGLILEESPHADGQCRSIRLNARGLRIACRRPAKVGSLHALARLTLRQAPFHLTFSPIDYDALEASWAFELDYRGNHDQLVAETLMVDHPLWGFLADDRVHHPIECQPYLGVALSKSCDLQAYLEIRSRTTTYELRTGQYEKRPLTVTLRVRRYWGFGAPSDPATVYNDLVRIGETIAAERIVPQVVNPLADAIASRL